MAKSNNSNATAVASSNASSNASNVSVLAVLGAGTSVSIACGAQAFARSMQSLEHIATAALAGSIALEQWATSALNANNQQKLNQEVAKTTILK